MDPHKSVKKEWYSSISQHTIPNRMQYKGNSLKVYEHQN